MNTLIFTALLWGAWKSWKWSKENYVEEEIFAKRFCSVVLVICAILFALVNLK